MQFKEKLQILRKRHGLSQKQLAEQIGFSRSFIRELEYGDRKPNVSHIIKISDLFGVRADVLIRDELDLDDNDM
jgi:transcriptional regulator with XRE-family HTH domain